MTVLEELQMLVDELEAGIAKQLLRTLVDDLNEEQGRVALMRLRELRRPFLEKFGFST